MAFPAVGSEEWLYGESREHTDPVYWRSRANAASWPGCQLQTVRAESAQCPWSRKGEDDRLSSRQGLMHCATLQQGTRSPGRSRKRRPKAFSDGGKRSWAGADHASDERGGKQSGCMQSRQQSRDKLEARAGGVGPRW